MTNNQLKKAFSSCFLLKNEAIMEEINTLIKGYIVDSVVCNNEQYVIKMSDKNKNTISMVIDSDSIHVTRNENGVFSNIAFYDTQVMRQTDIEKRDKGLIYTETCKRFARSRKFNNSSVLTDLEQESYTFSADTINTILNDKDYREVDSNQIFIRLKSLGMKANLEDAADLFTTFSTHMNYYYGWEGGRQITDNFYPTKTLVNGENLSMLFDVNDKNHTSINQLKGLQRYAPIDYSFEAIEKSPIRLAILSPIQQIDNIIGHLNNLNAKHSAKSSEMFLPNYEGFYDTYKRSLNIPDKNNNQLCRTYDETVTCNENTKSFVDSIKSQIDYFQTQLSDFDVLVIYIPKSFTKFREDSGYDPDFNLHDAIKLYGTNKGVKIQFIE